MQTLSPEERCYIGNAMARRVQIERAKMRQIEYDGLCGEPLATDDPITVAAIHSNNDRIVEHAANVKMIEGWDEIVLEQAQINLGQLMHIIRKYVIG